MTKYIFFLFAWPTFAFAADTRWAVRMGPEARATIESLRSCGVEGRPLQKRLRRGWSAPFLLVSRLPARVSTCDSGPWVFLRDPEMIVRLREFMIAHEGLLLDLGAAGRPARVASVEEAGWRSLHDLEPALGPALLLVRPEADLYDLIGSLRGFEDEAFGLGRKIEERLRALLIPKTLTDRTLRFVREARMAAASGHALADARREVEYQQFIHDTVMELANPVVSRLHREQRLRELRARFYQEYAFDFAHAYLLILTTLPEELRAFVHLYLGDVVHPADYHVLGLQEVFPKCAELLG